MKFKFSSSFLILSDFCLSFYFLYLFLKTLSLIRYLVLHLLYLMSKHLHFFIMFTFIKLFLFLSLQKLSWNIGVKSFWIINCISWWRTQWWCTIFSLPYPLMNYDLSLIDLWLFLSLKLPLLLDASLHLLSLCSIFCLLLLLSFQIEVSLILLV